MKNCCLQNRGVIIILSFCLFSFTILSIHAQDSIEVQFEAGDSSFNALMLTNQNDSGITKLIRIDSHVACLLGENERINGKIQAIFDSGIFIKSDTVLFSQMAAISYDPLLLKIYLWTSGVTGTLLGAALLIPGIWMGSLVIKDLWINREISNMGTLFAVLIAPQLLLYGVPVLAGGITQLLLPRIVLPHFYLYINAPWKIEPVYQPPKLKN